MAGAVETVLYLETPITGPLADAFHPRDHSAASVLPARVTTTRRRALQRDFAGAALETTWAPNLRSTLTLPRSASIEPTCQGHKEQFAILASLEVDVFKGLTIKPTYAYAFYNGANCGTNNRGRRTSVASLRRDKLHRAPVGNNGVGDLKRHYLVLTHG